MIFLSDDVTLLLKHFLQKSINITILPTDVGHVIKLLKIL